MLGVSTPPHPTSLFLSELSEVAPMLEIPRKLHCALAGMNVEVFKELQKNERLPRLPAQFKAKKGFAPIETVALAIANTLVERHHIPRELAANICSGPAAAILGERWK